MGKRLGLDAKGSLAYPLWPGHPSVREWELKEVQASVGAESHGTGRELVNSGRQVSDRVNGLP